MRVITTFGLAFAVAAASFALTMLIDPPVSEANPIASIDTYAITISSKIGSGEDYDCN